VSRTRHLLLLSILSGCCAANGWKWGGGGKPGDVQSALFPDVDAGASSGGSSNGDAAGGDGGADHSEALTGGTAGAAPTDGRAGGGGSATPGSGGSATGGSGGADSSGTVGNGLATTARGTTPPPAIIIERADKSICNATKRPFGDVSVTISFGKISVPKITVPAGMTCRQWRAPLESDNMAAAVECGCYIADHGKLRFEVTPDLDGRYEVSAGALKYESTGALYFPAKPLLDRKLKRGKVQSVAVDTAKLMAPPPAAPSAPMAPKPSPKAKPKTP